MVQNAVKALKLRFSEEFEFVKAAQKRPVYLFLVKHGLWSLVWSFIPKQLEELSTKRDLEGAAHLVIGALNGKNPEFARKLEKCVELAKHRIETRVERVAGLPNDAQGPKETRGLNRHGYR
jgi:hypothetical protein